ncbi:MAG: hypothetical protein BWY25_02298 [Chloroflexi bacterium ADurb.Bin222]|nr:MAG: hypothetical protein BWY25_02298 [Chloroflexi bacterium ADurb.Bin222]
MLFPDPAASHRVRDLFSRKVEGVDHHLIRVEHLGHAVHHRLQRLFNAHQGGDRTVRPIQRLSPCQRSLGLTEKLRVLNEDHHLAGQQLSQILIVRRESSPLPVIRRHKDADDLILPQKRNGHGRAERRGLEFGRTIGPLSVIIPYLELFGDIGLAHQPLTRRQPRPHFGRVAALQ